MRIAPKIALKIALLQHNPKVGDCSANARQLATLARKAEELPLARKNDGERLLCLTTACALTGTPWRPLTLAGGFYERCASSADELAAMLPANIDMLLQTPTAEGIRFLLVSHGKARPVRPDRQGILSLPDLRLFLPSRDPKDFSKPDADAALFMTAHSWIPGIQAKREARCAELAQNWELPVFLTNPYGATGGDVYAGQSCVFQPDGQLAARAAAFAEDVMTCALEGTGLAVACPDKAVKPDPDRMSGLFQAITLGIRDYVNKCGMAGTLIGLSGGMDSALVACLAAEAVGPERVLAVLMPSQWSSDHSLTDARQLAERLGVLTVTAPIGGMMQAFDETLAPLFADISADSGKTAGAPKADLTAENLQPRIRGTLLMAFANRLNLLTLAPSNKSEAAMGYCTLYGDTVGGLEPIGDLYKTEVYELGRWYNAMKGREIIPEHIFSKAPSAELRPGQTDQDSLPPYEVLDPILRELLENGAAPEKLEIAGTDRATIRDVVRDVARRLELSEFKRHQTPPVIRLSSRALGADWRMPVPARIFE